MSGLFVNFIIILVSLKSGLIDQKKGKGENFWLVKQSLFLKFGKKVSERDRGYLFVCAILHIFDPCCSGRGLLLGGRVRIPHILTNSKQGGLAVISYLSKVLI